jgi:hypothetical protein
MQLQQEDSRRIVSIMDSQKEDSQRIISIVDIQKDDSERLHELVRQYMEDRERTLNEAKHQATVERDKKHTDLIEWFSTPPGSFSDQDELLKVRSMSGVHGGWILKDEKVQNWRETDPPSSSLLWLNGKPGAGNSMKPHSIILRSNM